MAKNDKKPIDPLEAAKKAAPEEAAAEAAPAVEAPATNLVPIELGAPVTKAMVEMPPGPPDVTAVSSSKFRVVETTTISLGGVFVRLNRDDVVSASLYGPQGLKQIIDANVPLQELPEVK